MDSAAGHSCPVIHSNTSWFAQDTETGNDTADMSWQIAQRRTGAFAQHFFASSSSWKKASKDHTGSVPQSAQHQHTDQSQTIQVIQANLRQHHMHTTTADKSLLRTKDTNAGWNMTANDPALAADDYGLSAAHKRMPLDCCYANQCRNRLGVLMHSSPVKSIHSRCKSHWISRGNRSASDDYVHSCFFKQRDIAVACLQYQSTSLNTFVGTHQAQSITHKASNTFRW